MTTSFRHMHDGFAIRWIISRDLPRVVEIEEWSFSEPWREDEFRHQLRRGTCVGLVATLDNVVIGFVIYDLIKSSIDIINMAVDPMFRRRGCGRALIDRLVSKLMPQRRRRLTVTVRERNISAAMFFRGCGMRSRLVRDYYDDEDGIEFVYLTTTMTRSTT